ncbi:heparanase-like protein [Musa troglodytarum]|uniref:Heparanase-like protein n=1 Tax=Musa troglodytarum TaxID=320322 RepID=A0A9E7J9Q0_9LILI|nr:heparanase-like protein [Musa troglodytarum]
MVLPAFKESSSCRRYRLKVRCREAADTEWATAGPVWRTSHRLLCLAGNSSASFVMATANLVLSLLLLLLLSSDGPGHVNVSVRADYVVARTDGNFICATKCDFGDCSWGRTSIKNLHSCHRPKDAVLGVRCNARAKLDAVVLTAFGTMRDQVTYTSKPCHEFKAADGDSDYEFKDGCISLNRWDKIHEFFNTTGVVVVVGLHNLRNQCPSWEGPWDAENARFFIRHIVQNKQYVDSWEFGSNELCGNGDKSNFLVDGKQYGLDLIAFKAMLVDEVAAPGGFYVEDWFKNMLSASGYGVVDVVTHHVYNLGSGHPPPSASSSRSGDGNLVGKVTDPKVLDNIVSTYDEVLCLGGRIRWRSQQRRQGAVEHLCEWFLVRVDTTRDRLPKLKVYLDQLGMVSRLHHKVFCRQTLIGGNYGLLDHDTFVPNPDYYRSTSSSSSSWNSALLWHRLMGAGVLEASHDGPAHLRSYAHCSKNTPGGVTLLLINLSDSITFEVAINGGTKSYEREIRIKARGRSSISHPKTAISRAPARTASLLWIPWSSTLLIHFASRTSMPLLADNSM